MSNLRLLLSLSLAAVLPSVAFAVEMKDMPAAIGYRDNDKAALELPPLSYNEVLNPLTGEELTPFDVIVQEDKNGVYTPIYGEEVLTLINKNERFLNTIGESLRNGDVQLKKLMLPNPDFTIRGLASDTGVSLSKLTESYQEGLDDCEKIDIKSLGINPLTRNPYTSADKISFGKSLTVKVGDLIPKLDQQQKMFCALGYSLFENLGGEGVVEGLLAKRDQLIAKFGISSDNSSYSLTSWVNTSTLSDIASRVSSVQEALKNPTPEKLYILAMSNKDIIPESMQLPELPRFDSPILNKRTDLKLLKEYRWPGFTEGKRDLVQAYAAAWTELRAGHTSGGANAPVSEYSVQGEAGGGLFIFNKEVPLLKGMLDAQLNDANANADVTFCYLGNCSKKQYGKTDAGLHAGDPELFKKNWQESYSQQMVIGVVPVVFRAGAGLYAQLGWSANLTLLSANGDITGQVKGDVFGEAAVGVKDFLEAGAGGRVEVINDTVTLRSEANLRFRGNGYPVLEATLTGDNKLSALNGAIYGYAMVDLMGPFGELAEEIVKSLEKLGSSAEAALRQLSNVSDTAKKLVKGIENAGKAISKGFKKMRKKLGFQAPHLNGTGFGVSVTGLKIRYEEDILTWDGISKNTRFLNYKILKAPDGHTTEGDVGGSLSEDSLAAFEQNLELEAYKVMLEAKAKQAEQLETDSKNDLSAFIQESQALAIEQVQSELSTQLKVLLDRKSAIIQKTISE